MTSRAIDAETRAAVIDGLLRLLREHYLFPEVAGRVEADIRERLTGGEYDAIRDPAAFREVLTDHMQGVSRDGHLRLFHSEEPQPPQEEETGELTPQQREEFRVSSMLDNFGFHRVERLAGNVGYLDLRALVDPEFGAARAAVAAMNLLSDAGALIIDLRKNGGGSPNMVALLCSYLFGPEPVHLNDIQWKAEDRTQQFWTLPHVPGERYPDKSVYVLTSRFTFSGAEEFAYNLKTLRRATVVGETTGGGAHLVDRYRIDAHFYATIPVARAINPITGTNWEGTGVVPDVKVPQEGALEAAHRAALEGVVADLGDDPRGPYRALREEAQRTLADLRASEDSSPETD